MSLDYAMCKVDDTLFVELLTRRILLIGRSPGSDIRLGPGTVSRTHACLFVHGGEIRVRDLFSANGTFVNGQRIASDTPLRPEDEVSFGPEARVRVRWQHHAMSA